MSFKHKDGTDGLVLGGPFDDTVESDPRFVGVGFVRPHEMRWHEYVSQKRGDGTTLYIYSGSRATINRRKK